MVCAIRRWASLPLGVKRRPCPTLSHHGSSAAYTVSGVIQTDIWQSTTELVEGILGGSRTSLSRAITLVESQRLDHRRQAELLLDKVLSARHCSRLRQQARDRKFTHANGGPGVSGGSAESEADASASLLSSLGMRVGIAGPPGAGKSSFIEVLGKELTAAGRRVAVISVDPSSIRTGGSILGDKTRMHELSRDPSAFVRGCPARGVLGGISRYTHEVVLLCQVAGYDPVIVETVGLGQSEVEVEHAVDMLLLLLPPVGGDDLQGSKKGIVEVADAIVVNKADGELEKAARATASDYAAAMAFARRKFSSWNPPILRCSALRKQGIRQVWEQISLFRTTMEAQGILTARRRQQATHWVRRHLQQQLMDRASRDPALQLLSKSLEPDLAQGRLSPRAAAEMLADRLLQGDHGAPEHSAGKASRCSPRSSKRT